MRWTKQAFCELWGPLTNIFDHEVGEVGISLHDLKRVGGLSTLGAMYEEFLPLNKDLVEHNKYPAATVELLRIPTKLCKFYNVGHIYYDLWLDHFCREYLEYFAYEEHTYSEKGKVETKKRSPLCISRQKRMTDLNVIAEGELAAFLAFCLSRPVLPYGKEVIKPETFIMDTLMAFGRGQQVIETILVKLIQFLPIYDSPDSDCRSHFPTLVRYAGWLGRKLSLPQARHVFRDGRYLSLRASSYHEDSRNGRDVIDIGLPDEDFKFLLPIWSFYFLYVLELNYFWSPITPTDLLTNLDSIKGAEVIIGIISNHGSARDLLASRQRVSQSLSALCSMIDICKLNTIEIFWLSSKIEEIFGVVETAAKIEELVDLYLTKISLVFLKLLTLKVSPITYLMKLQNFRLRSRSLIEVENKLKSSLDLKKKQAEKDLEKEKDHLKILIGSVISFSNV
ncbi:hypothetical protein Cgig2_024536 [Carnegiea gigantea]|uniref:Aminotransferase-like plant mobile domain-containing protein n=1 Tax=Carnegiea gigantea TaxID=171969 RepID=A0A9Q1JXF4_9CARY|nr:hypothetical protein Cgig2_024536 [Carnegiea gigantea]